VIYFLTHIQDNLANNHLGIKIEPSIIEPFLSELKEIIGEDDYKTYTENQQKRDKGQFYLNVISVTEYNQLTQEQGMDKFTNSLQKVFEYEIDDLKMMGIGSATKNENRSYFIVCKSEKLEAIRKRYELQDEDFYITIGFKWRDVHGVRKNIVVEKVDKFLKLLQSEFYKNENWEFIKKIGNFNLNKDDELIPVKLTDTRMQFKTGKHYISVGLLDDERFWILNQYPIEDDLPRLSQTEISKIFSKNKKI